MSHKTLIFVALSALIHSGAAAWAGCGPPECQFPDPTPRDYCYDRCLNQGHSVEFCDGRCEFVPSEPVEFVPPAPIY